MNKTIQAQTEPNTTPENTGIAACMRLNAKLTRRVAALTQVLEGIIGPIPCSAAMVSDEEGKPFPPDIAAIIKVAHENHCIRCVARAALVADLERS